MKIWIESSALAGPSDDLLWNGTLFGLNYLKQLDHYCSFKVAELTEQQQKLLHNDKLSTESFPKDEADFWVNTKADKLILSEKGRPERAFKNWVDLSDAICFPQRKATHTRQTAETEIDIKLNLDGDGLNDINTGVGFLDHMLEQIAKHGLIDLSLHCEGDLEIDEHHTIEDIAIALGTAINKALGDKKGISRYSFSVPMDESAATILLDFSGRPFLKFEGNFNREKVGDFPTEMVEHFFYSLAMNLKATLHISVEGENDHHKIEAIFKGFGRCLRSSITRSERNLNILPSTKDLL